MHHTNKQHLIGMTIFYRPVSSLWSERAKNKNEKKKKKKKPPLTVFMPQLIKKYRYPVSATVGVCVCGGGVCLCVRACVRA